MKPQTTVKLIGLLIALAIVVWFLHSTSWLASEQAEHRRLQERHETARKSLLCESGQREFCSGGTHGR